MIVSEYEARFHVLSRYVMSNISTKFEKIHRFVKGLTSYIQEATTFLVLSSSFF